MPWAARNLFTKFLGPNATLLKRTDDIKRLVFANGPTVTSSRFSWSRTCSWILFYVTESWIFSRKSVISQTEAHRRRVTCLGPPTGKAAPIHVPREGGWLSLQEGASLVQLTKGNHDAFVLNELYFQGVTFSLPCPQILWHLKVVPRCISPSPPGHGGLHTW